MINLANRQRRVLASYCLQEAQIADGLAEQILELGPGLSPAVRKYRLEAAVYMEMRRLLASGESFTVSAADVK